ncbi:MAG TPA: serine/threonine-protein kinase, partial [Thermoanaerobaculia bacterium]
MPDRPFDDATVARADTPSSAAGSRFAPGSMVAGRYRIVALLGRGGMGEVYRAEDVKIGQQVALKFLPKVDEKVYAEVRLGRQVSHPNVCRLYDIGESEEGHFITMEYVDGEDLASLLRRIGRLPADKALDIARDLSAGLAAAHDVGIVHRDLKPANVMIDGRGRARITDFGLAAVAQELKSGGGFVGTPAYMAPEQLAGGAVSPRSDLYALGLILYEVFTGKRLFSGSSLEEIRSQRRSTKPPSISSLVREIDPSIEKVILRCLEDDPAARPSSAHAVIASLPGGDALDAAVAKGETPSPEMVAAAGKIGDLQPAIAWPLLLLALVGPILIAAMAARSTLFNLVPLPKSPDVLDARGQEIAQHLGYSDQPASIAHWWIWNDDYNKYMVKRDRSTNRWKNIARTRPGVVLFVFRQSMRPMLAWNDERIIVDDDPPLMQQGMLRVTMDPPGRLIQLIAVPLLKDERAAVPTDWNALFREAEIDPARFHPVRAIWSAPVDTDEKRAWDGTLAEQPDVPLHIEAGAHRGRPVWFSVFGPWDQPPPLREPPRRITEVVGDMANILLETGMIV